MYRKVQDNPFAEICERLHRKPGQAPEDGSDDSRQLEEAFIELIFCTQDRSFRNIRHINTLPSDFVARTMATSWPGWSEEQHHFLINMLAEGVTEPDYLTCALAIASAVAVVDARSGIIMLAKLEGKLQSGKKKLGRYHGLVRRYFLENGAEAFYSISQARDAFKGDIISAGRQLVHACFLLKNQKQGVQPEVQHDVLQWLVNSDILLPLVGKHEDPIQNAVQVWPLAMAPRVLTLRDKMLERKPDCDFLADILPLLKPVNTGPSDKGATAEATARTMHLTPEAILESLAAHLRRISDEKGTLERELAAVRDELRQHKEKYANMDSERRNTEQILANTERMFLEYRSVMENNAAKLRDRNSVCLSAKAKAEKEATSLKEQLTACERRIRDMEGRVQDLEDRHKEEIAQISGRVEAESKHAAEELRRAIIADIDADFRELQHLEDSEENRIASIMLKSIFRKLARNGIHFDKLN